MKDCKVIDTCIACGGKNLFSVFDLGLQPLANSYKRTANEQELIFPLGINSCNDCHHVQLTHKVNPELLFKTYAYTSGVSKTALEFFDWFAKTSIKYFNKSPKSVLDIGCNDGSQLDIYRAMGLETYGVDPAENHYVETSKRHNIVCNFFKDGLFNCKFDIVTVQNAFAHNDNQLGLLRNIRPIMHDQSLLFAVTSHADMLLNGEFDTIYHEHLSFFNINSMNELCKSAGMNLVDVIRHPIHGNSYIFVISKSFNHDGHIKALIKAEKDRGLYDVKLLQEFKKNAVETVEKVRNLYKTCQETGMPFVGYSAPAKSTTFLNFAKITPDFIIDDTPLKQGTYSPGVSAPIYDASAFERINNHNAVCFVIFAWNFYDEIKEKILKARPDKNDIFVRYFPKYKIE